MPTDLDLAIPVRKRLEDDCPHGNATRATDYSPPAKPWVCGKLGEVPLDAFNRLLTIQHRRRRKPAHDLGPSVNLDEAINLIHPPRSDDDADGFRDPTKVAAIDHPSMLASAAAPNSSELSRTVTFLTQNVTQAAAWAPQGNGGHRAS